MAFEQRTRMVPPMIMLTRLSGSPFVLNSDLIERIDSAPDTIITLVDGSKYVVSEHMRDIVAAIRRHRAEVIALSEVAQVIGEASAEAHSHQQPPAPADHVAAWTTLAATLAEHDAPRPTLSVVAARDEEKH